ncbi:MAG: hypothetical protein Q8K64_16615 [Sediminibacterium sp.]|nr:MAG: hypothetical protein FD183_206 [Chitinophagaceae bacterium]MDP1845038.1 hypothetical protein [Sediminibacterium sp.]TXT33849.1 MAG: hypothetical protein FD136_659 [Chitinophagaceae bacterium]
MKQKRTYIILLIVLLKTMPAFSQLGAPVFGGLDTLYMPSDSLSLTIDPDPNNNPFLNGGQNPMRAADDPGGPGSGGGAGDPPPDAIIPFDGVGVVVLVLSGALIGLWRRKKSSQASTITQ